MMQHKFNDDKTFTKAGIKEKMQQFSAEKKTQN